MDNVKIVSDSERLLTMIFDFSDYFHVNPPKTNNIGDWWEDALKEMDIKVLRSLHGNNAYDNKLAKSRMVKKMDKMIENRIAELEKEHLNFIM